MSIESRLRRLEEQRERETEVEYPPLYMPPFQTEEAVEGRCIVAAYQYRAEADADLVARLDRLPRAGKLCDGVTARFVRQTREDSADRLAAGFAFAAADIEDELRDRAQARALNETILRRNPSATTIDYEYLVTDAELEACLDLARSYCVEHGGRPPTPAERAEQRRASIEYQGGRTRTRPGDGGDS
jgi:hypothetical protein